MKKSLQDNRLLYNVFRFLYLLCGIGGLFFIFAGAEGLSFRKGYAVLIFAGAALVLFVCSRISYPAFFFLFLGGLGGLIYYIYRNADDLLEEVYSVGNVLLNETGPVLPDMTRVIVIGGLLLTLFVTALESTVGGHIILFFFYTAVLGLCAAAGIRISTMSLILMGAFTVFFWVLPSEGEVRTDVMEGRDRRHLLLLAHGTILLFFLCFFAGRRITDLYEDHLRDAVYKAEEAVVTTAEKAIQRADYVRKDGEINRGDLYYSGTEEFSVSCSEAPEEPFYLVHFRGGIYSDGAFEDAAEEDKLRSYLISHALSEWKESLLSVSPQLYFIRNYGVQDWYGGRETGDDSNRMTLTYLKTDLADGLIPYFSTEYADGGRTRLSSAARTEYRFYTISQMRGEWAERYDIYEEDILAAVNTFDTLQEIYEEAIPSIGDYRSYPSEGLSALKALVDSEPLASTEEITAFIAYTLGNNTRYTRTPGVMPIGVDPAEYFLFEGKRGYCQHYALTAMLMYRMYGCTARYCVGYRLMPDQFVRNADGTYSAVIADNNRHAWVEIFLAGYGWVPVEMTPAESIADAGLVSPQEGDAALVLSQAGLPVPVYPGLTAEELKAIMEEHGWVLPQTITPLNITPEAVPGQEESRPEASDQTSRPESGPEETQENHDPEGSGAGSGGQGSSMAQTLRTVGKIFLILAVIGAVIAGLWFGLPPLLRALRAAHLRRISNMTCRQLYRHFVRMLHFAGIAKEESGNEENFPGDAFGEIRNWTAGKDPAKMGVLVPPSEEEIRSMYLYAERSAFDKEEPCEEEKEAMRNMYFLVSDMIRNGLDPVRKFIFRYVTGY